MEIEIVDEWSNIEEAGCTIKLPDGTLLTFSAQLESCSCKYGYVSAILYTEGGKGEAKWKS